VQESSSLPPQALAPRLPPHLTSSPRSVRRPPRSVVGAPRSRAACRARVSSQVHAPRTEVARWSRLHAPVAVSREVLAPVSRYTCASRSPASRFCRVRSWTQAQTTRPALKKLFAYTVSAQRG
jgi:hypothetical protein